MLSRCPNCGSIRTEGSTVCVACGHILTPPSMEPVRPPIETVAEPPRSDAPATPVAPEAMPAGLPMPPSAPPAAPPAPPVTPPFAAPPLPPAASPGVWSGVRWGSEEPSAGQPYPARPAQPYPAPQQPYPAQAAQAYPAAPPPYTGQPFGQPYPNQPYGTAPTVCWRCGAAVFPGAAVCSACGADLRPLWQPMPQRRSRLPIFVALIGIAILVVAGTLVLVNPFGGSWSPDAEPSPNAAWHQFTAPDGSWSVMFPGSGSPMSVNQSIDAGIAKMNMTLYMSMDGAGAYEAAGIDMPAYATAGESEESILDQMGSSMFKGFGGNVEGSRKLTFQGHAAREFKFSMSNGMDGYARFFFNNSRMYMLMVLRTSGTTVYPEHFFESFQFK